MQRIPKPHFPLEILPRDELVDWWHLRGTGFKLTPAELPDPLEAMIRPILWWMGELDLERFVLGNHPLETAPQNSGRILRLTAWWVEWGRRREVTDERFTCTHCDATIKKPARTIPPSTSPYPCRATDCRTAPLFLLATGKPVLSLVPAAKKKTG